MEAKTTVRIRTTLAIADALSFYCAITIVALMLTGAYTYSFTAGGGRGSRLPEVNRRPCDEIYVVGEGETLHTISDKCGDPFIVERNPHIHDPDDVFSDSTEFVSAIARVNFACDRAGFHQGLVAGYAAAQGGIALEKLAGYNPEASTVAREARRSFGEGELPAIQDMQNVSTMFDLYNFLNGNGAGEIGESSGKDVGERVGGNDDGGGGGGD